jgi:hypothetical protein
MRAPIDPSEPLFPVRPNEPVCQYYMKHGSCKFGQACKFHHPPQSSVAAASLVGSNAIFIPRANEGGALPQHILLNQVGADQGSSTMMLQFLPQRPDEPDCLYFLRNGTCKYGATCRYHHPVNQQRKPAEAQQRRQPQMIKMPAHVSNDGAVQFVQTQQSFPPQSTRVVSTSGGQHMLVTETPIQVMSMNNGGYQQVSVPMSNGEAEFVPTSGSQMGSGLGGMSRDHASSSSSIASSYETASSNIEYITQGQGGWNRFKRSTSGGSLSAYGEPVRHQPMHPGNRVIGSHAGNDNSGRLRTTSFGSMGSASDQSSYHDGVMGWSGGNGPTGSRAIPQERYVEGGHAFEQPRRQHHHQRVDAYEGRNTVREEPQRQSQEQGRSRPRGQGPPRQSKSGNVDHGLSMMTSALLNMLDTPEEAAARSYPSRISSSSTLNNSGSPPVTPRSGNMQSPQHSSVPVLNERLMAQSTSSSSLYQPEVRHQVVYTTQNLSGYSLRDESRTTMYAPSKQQDPAYGNVDHFEDADHYWSPSWQDSSHPIDQHSQSKQVHMPHRPSNGPASPQASNVGLYLP